jgi:hypothetical protein
MKTLALTPWLINPPTTGGTQRCYNLLKNIDDLTIMSLDWDGEKEYKRHEGTTTYHVIPADPEAKEQARKLFQSSIFLTDGTDLLGAGTEAPAVTGSATICVEYILFNTGSSGAP